MSRFLDYARDHVLLCDGAMGSRVQAMDLDIDADYWGQENCTEVLNLSVPDKVREIHRAYFDAGADMVETNTFGGSPITLSEFDLHNRAMEINQRAAEIAREALEQCPKDGRERFVLGSIGPGTRLPTLGHVSYDDLEAALTTQAAGLIAGGVDAMLVETSQDMLQVKAAINGIRNALAAANADIPIIAQVTVETTGTLLVGADIAAAATVLDAMKVPIMGLNCATGPQEMAEHIKWLGDNWSGMLSVMPNAGLPELVDGQTCYPLQPADLRDWMRRFVTEDGIGLIGGCCGTTAEHIAALDALLRELAPAGRHRPAPKRRVVSPVPAVASLYGQVTYAQENAYFAIGERCNANGSRKFRELQDAGEWDACVAIGREQEGEGSHALDLCTAFVGRDEISDMTEVLTRMRTAVNLPVVIDSTELPVLDAALKLYGGKAIINSINFEDGEEPAAKRLGLARKFGAGVVALTIDEDGMAKTVDDKIRVAKRLYDFAVNQHGLPPADLLFDPLTFTICTGNVDDRKLGLWTLDAIARIREELPDCQIVLGLSNISFGLNPPARHVLNSVYLDHALKRGLSGAIVHPSKIRPLHAIPEAEVTAAEDLIYDRRREGYDPLEAFMALFEGRKAEAAVKKQRAETVEERLKDRIVDGDGQGLQDDLDEAMKSHPPLDIINIHLLAGMKVVGELFGAGKMQLPFVLRSAEVMKAAVGHLEQFMERVEGQQRGTIVLATVKGDVHDIGKNLVDIILTNNGYKVVNLGIKQPLANIVDAAREHTADAIGMSGLLVKSTVVMRENLEQMTREELNIPVFLGGAALTRRYVEEDCVAAYGAGRVAYARDAFDGLSLMDQVVTGGFDGYVAERGAAQKSRPTNTKRTLGAPGDPVDRPVDLEETRIRRDELSAGVDVPEPPFWGARLVENVPVKALVPFLNERMLFQFHWGYRKQGRSLQDYMIWARKELRPILNRILADAAAEQAFAPQAAYGFWPAAAEGNDLIIFAEGGEQEVARFTLPRQRREGGLCIADFFRDASRGPGDRDVIGLQVVTVGQRASEIAREWFAADRYQDYLYLHGLGVELAEALAEYVHRNIRAQFGSAADDAREMDTMLAQGYRGSRYSFGYPACPNLADQVPLLSLLDAKRIDVRVSDESFQLHPEQSTSAIVVHHPQAKYFSV